MDLEQIMELADRLVVMADGKVISRINANEATKDEILSLLILGGAAPEDRPKAEAARSTEMKGDK